MITAKKHTECKRCSTAFPFYSVSASGHRDHPFGGHPGGWVHQGIAHSLRFSKDGPAFHPCGVQSRGLVHQGIADHCLFAKNGPTNLIRRNEPASGLVTSNAILRFDKSSNAHHDSQTEDTPYALGDSFIGIVHLREVSGESR